MISRGSLMILCVFLLHQTLLANHPNNLPPLDEETAELLVKKMGAFLNEQTRLAEEDPNYPKFADAHYRKSFEELSGAIDYKFSSLIKSQIIYRTGKIRSSTERTLGLSDMYMPVFEEYLSKKGMPRHLKYLPIVESNLNAVARSHASAVGLWQFIPGTARFYGLKVASYYDERSDTHKATDAATTMLLNLYKRYGDWCLALAAYNCGLGRVDKIVKRKGYDFWKIRKYLPKETQMYVPFFMSVVYTYEYYHLHELKPRPVDMELVVTDTLHLTAGYKSLKSLSQKYDVPQDVLKRLNPCYRRNYVPSKTKNPILVVPSRVVAKERGLEEAYSRIMSIQTENPIKCMRRVNSEKELKTFMKAHQCDRQDVLFWNRLPKDYRIQTGDMIAFRKYYAPKDIKSNYNNTRESIEGIKIPSLKVVGLDDKQEKALTAPVYVNVSAKKSATHPKTSAPAASNGTPRMEVVSAQNPYKKSHTTVPAASKQDIIERVSKDRSRKRRLRGRKIATKKQFVPSKQPIKKPEISAAKAAPSTAKKSKTSAANTQTLVDKLHDKESAAVNATEKTNQTEAEKKALKFLQKETKEQK